MPSVLDMLQCLKCGTYFLPNHTTAEVTKLCSSCSEAASKRTGKLPERGSIIDEEV